MFRRLRRATDHWQNGITATRLQHFVIGDTTYEFRRVFDIARTSQCVGWQRHLRSRQRTDGRDQPRRVERAFPRWEPVTFQRDEEYETSEVYAANITHNLGRMAEEAGIYKHLWRPEEIGVTKASQLIEPLSIGVALMKREPERFIALSPANDWGSYDGFVPWIERYIAACCEFPEAEVSVSR